MTNTQREKLKQAAMEAADYSYAPYSQFHVGAAILTEDGNMVKGCNVENVSYGLSNCAERTAMFNAISLGYKKEDMKAMAIYAKSPTLTPPCGACRQVMVELLDPDTPIILYNGETSKTYTVEKLMPEAFDFFLPE